MIIGGRNVDDLSREELIFLLTGADRIIASSDEAGEREIKQARIEKLEGIMLDLIVFGSVALDPEETSENRESGALLLRASIKQARILLGLQSPTRNKGAGDDRT